MEFAVAYFPTHDAMSPGDVAKMVEEHGQWALYFAEHTHIPSSRASPYPSGGDLPRKYWHTYDLFVALTAAACATSRLRIGSGVCLVIQRDPIITAKQVASLDHLSGGRFEFGIGAGWNREEMSNHGTDPRTRMKLMHERMDAMKAIWTQDEASYSGEFVEFDRIWCEPKPAQRPYPPILVGGGGPTVVDRVLAFGDVWFAQWRDFDESRIAEVGARAERPVYVDMSDLPRTAVAIERCARLGIRSVSTWLPSGGRNVVERALDEWNSAIGEFTGT